MDRKLKKITSYLRAKAKKMKSSGSCVYDYDKYIKDSIICNFVTSEDSGFPQRFNAIKRLLAEIEKRQQEDLDDIDEIFG